MTTIAFDGRTLAVDRASWQGDYVWSAVTKLFEIKAHLDCVKRFRLHGVPPAGELYLVWAAAGDASAIPLILTWMVGGGEIPPIQGKSTTSFGLILETGTRSIFRLTSRCTLEPLSEWPVADGGGFQIALGAMLAGKTAVEAIEIVASRSGWAAGGVDSYTLPSLAKGSDINLGGSTRGYDD